MPRGAAVSPHTIDWTEEMCAKLKDLMGTKSGATSYIPIGRVVDLMNQAFPGNNWTRNAVIGKARRLKLDLAFPRSKQARLPNPARTAAGYSKPIGRPKGSKDKYPRGTKHAFTPPAPTPRHSNPLGAGLLREPPSPETVAQVEARMETPMEGHKLVPLLDAADTMCVWPMGVHEGVPMCCGRLRYDNGSRVRPSRYCAHHANVGHQALRPHMPTEGIRRKRPKGQLNRFG